MVGGREAKATTMVVWDRCRGVCWAHRASKAPDPSSFELQPHTAIVFLFRIRIRGAARQEIVAKATAPVRRACKTRSQGAIPNPQSEPLALECGADPMPIFVIGWQVAGGGGESCVPDTEDDGLLIRRCGSGNNIHMPNPIHDLVLLYFGICRG